jgi:hypothetical protein
MPAKSSENDQRTDGSQDCKCGKETLDCLTHPSTPDKWTAFMRDSLAKTLALLENRQAYLREPDQVFTEKSCVSLAWFDQNNSTWKTYQQSFLTDSEPYLETWPRWGMTQDGSAYAHPMSERRITETDGFAYVPTPDTRNDRGANKLETIRTKLERGSRAHLGQLNNYVVWVLGERHGKLNPEWIESLMMFPIGHTGLKDWVTPKSRCKPPLHTDSLEENNG